MIRITLIIFICHFLTYSFSQNLISPSIINVSIAYDTVKLKNNYLLVFAKTDKFRILHLVGPGIDTVIITKPINLNQNSFVSLASDYNDYFLINNSYDEDYTYWMQIFKKQTDHLVASGRVIEFDTINNVIYFEDNYKQNVLNLFDFNKSKMEKYITPMVPCLHWWYCIKIIGITEKELTIEYTGHNNSKIRKKYLR